MRPVRHVCMRPGRAWLMPPPSDPGQGRVRRRTGKQRHAPFSTAILPVQPELHVRVPVVVAIAKQAHLLVRRALFASSEYFAQLVSDWRGKSCPATTKHIGAASCIPPLRLFTSDHTSVDGGRSLWDNNRGVARMTTGGPVHSVTGDRVRLALSCRPAQRAVAKRLAFPP